MEHLREHWRQVTASRRTLYRGISLEGASRQYAWGLDEAIVRKFSSAMKKGDHQAAAKVVLDLCEQSGEFVEGGHFGVWWSTDHKVARGYAGMHTRTSLACVVHAEVDDEDINQGHGEEYGFTSEAPVVLREGARIDIVAVEVRYNPDLKVLRDGDFVLIPVRRQVTASDVSEYGMSHRPADDGPPAYDLTVEGEWSAPPDIYDHPDWYGASPESARALKAIRGNAQASVTIYRAGPKPEFNTGDWVSLSRSYAVQESMSESVGVWSATVPAKDVRWAGDSLDEFGYFGPSISGKKTATVKTWREKVDALPGEYTPAIMSAVENVLDEGYSEDDDEFWSRVYGEVMA